MIKTYLKHFVIDKFLNSIFDGLINTFDIMPELVVGKEYRMIIFEHNIKQRIINKSPTPTYTHTEYKSVVEHAILDKICNGLCIFSGGYISNYHNNILIYVTDIDTTFYLPTFRITMVFE